MVAFARFALFFFGCIVRQGIAKVEIALARASSLHLIHPLIRQSDECVDRIAFLTPGAARADEHVIRIAIDAAHVGDDSLRDAVCVLFLVDRERD